ncbi:MAG: beta-glucuronidase [Prevotella sp.]|nr:beta-glucuronidase [Prevotella sp.]
MSSFCPNIRRALAFTLFAFTSTLLCAEDYEVPQVVNVLGRPTTSLNGDWNYVVDVQEQGYSRFGEKEYGFFKNIKPRTPDEKIEYDFDASPTLRVPGDWNTQEPKLFFYEGCMWYHHRFDYHPRAGRRTLLYFGAVNYDALVFVNGKRMGHHEGGFTPFCFDVTDVLRDGSNFVIVKVNNKRRADAIPTESFDWWNYGGITRDVMLVDVAPVYIEDYNLQLTSLEGRRIAFSVKLNQAETGHTVTLSIPELKIKKTLTTDSDGWATISMKAKPTLWCPENPKLYKVEIAMDGDVITDEVGFRTIATEGKKILFNGKQVFLKGICVHEDKAYGGGRATNTEDAHTLLSWAKELGCNFVRLVHYPHNEYMVREAERMGIMVWSEIPVYWELTWDNPATYVNAEHQLHDMIARDHNRANVIIWSIANETPRIEARNNFLSRLSRYAHNMDSTRLVSLAMEVQSASNYVNRLQDDLNEYVDVISFNQYIGWYRDIHDAPLMKWEVPYNKPVIVSEFGGGAKYGLHGEKNLRWSEEFQENLYIENLAMLEKIDGLSGTTPWVLKDFYSPRRQLAGVQDYHNVKGVVSDNGEKKKAFFVLSDWYKRMAY